MATSPSVPISPELAEAALSCAPLARALRRAAWIGPGRSLTASGVLRPADAGQACRDLGIATPGPRLRSALDVEELMRDWMTAAEAGFLEFRGRQVRAAPDLPAAGGPAPEAVLGPWIRAASALLDVAEQPCAGCLMVLHELFTSDGTVPLEQLVSAIESVLEPDDPGGEPCPGCGEVHGPLGLDDFLGEWDEADERDPAGHAADTITGLLDFGAADTDGATVQLTPLGVLLADWVFRGRAPAPDASPAALIAAISELPPPVAQTVARSWLDARSAAQAGQELLGLAETATGGERAAALNLAQELGPEAWREQADQPGIGAYPRRWLSERGEAAAERPEDEDWLAVDALTMMLDTLAGLVPSPLLAAALAEQLGDEIEGAVALAGSVDHPRAAELVARLGGSPAPPAVPARPARIC
jgi:hypothetical protein